MSSKQSVEWIRIRDIEKLGTNRERIKIKFKTIQFPGRFSFVFIHE